MSQKTSKMTALWNLVRECKKCQIASLARNKVFGDGNVSSKVMFVGEGPGMDEDSTGHPFVGNAGRILSGAMRDAGIDRDKTFITNIVRCHPCKDPLTGNGNRKPTAEEIAACKPWLIEQIMVIRPNAIVALGGTAFEGLIGSSAAGEPILNLFGDSQRMTFSNGNEIFGTQLVVVCHPQFLGYNENNPGHIRVHGYEMSYPELRAEYSEVFKRVWLWAHQ